MLSRRVSSEWCWTWDKLSRWNTWFENPSGQSPGAGPSRELWQHRVLHSCWWHSSSSVLRVCNWQQGGKTLENLPTDVWRVPSLRWPSDRCSGCRGSIETPWKSQVRAERSCGSGHSRETFLLFPAHTRAGGGNYTPNQTKLQKTMVPLCIKPCLLCGCRGMKILLWGSAAVLGTVPSASLWADVSQISWSAPVPGAPAWVGEGLRPGLRQTSWSPQR